MFTIPAPRQSTLALLCSRVTAVSSTVLTLAARTPLSPREGKAVLKEIQEHVPGKVDISALGYATYQAPTLKHRILYEGGHKKYPIPDIPVVIPKSAKVSNSIEQLCINAFNRRGYSFLTVTEDGIVAHIHPK